MKRVMLLCLSLLMLIFQACGDLPANNTNENNVTEENITSIQLEGEPTDHHIMATTPIQATSAPIIVVEPIPNGSQYIVLSEIGFDRHFLIEISSGRTEEIQNTDHGIYQILEFSDECTMIARKYDKLFRTDIMGNMITELFSFNYDEDESLYKLAPSPNLNAVAYTLGRGYLDYDKFEFQDIYIMLADSTEIVEITERGGGWRGEWSNDGTMLAYSDYDEHGIQQLFVIDSSGNNRRQVSSFTNPGIDIRRIRWSEDNQQILFEFFPNGSRNILVLVISLGNENEIIYIDDFSEIREFWWYSDTLIILQATKSDGSNARGLFLVDVTNNRIVDEFLESQLNDPPFILVRPFGSPKYAGFFLYDTLYVYDFDKRQIHKYEKITRVVDFGDWFALPNPYDDLEFCGQYLP